MTNWEMYFGTPDRATVTLMDFLYHSKMSGKLDDQGRARVPGDRSLTPTFDITAECTMPTLNINSVNPGASISDWMGREVHDDAR